MDTFTVLLVCLVASTCASPISSPQAKPPNVRADYEFIEATNTFYKVHKDSLHRSSAYNLVSVCAKEDAVPLTTKDEDLELNLQAVFNKNPHIKYVCVLDHESNYAGLAISRGRDRLVTEYCKDLVCKITTNNKTGCQSASTIASSISSTYELRADYDYIETTNTFYKVHNETVLVSEDGVRVCADEGSVPLTVCDEDLELHLLAVFNKYPLIEYACLLDEKTETPYLGLGLVIRRDWHRFIMEACNFFVCKRTTMVKNETCCESVSSSDKINNQVTTDRINNQNRTTTDRSNYQYSSEWNYIRVTTEVDGLQVIRDNDGYQTTSKSEASTTSTQVTTEKSNNEAATEKIHYETATRSKGQSNDDIVANTFKRDSILTQSGYPVYTGYPYLPGYPVQPYPFVPAYPYGQFSGGAIPIQPPFPIYVITYVQPLMPACPCYVLKPGHDDTSAQGQNTLQPSYQTQQYTPYGVIGFAPVVFTPNCMGSSSFISQQFPGAEPVHYKCDHCGASSTHRNTRSAGMESRAINSLEELDDLLRNQIQPLRQDLHKIAANLGILGN